VYVFVSVPEGVVADASRAIASIREPEGLSLVLAETDAAAQGLVVQFRAAWLTLTVHSALEAVGLTAAFASALAEAGIGCNVVAGSFHDHLFVPYERAAEAMAVLADIQQQANDR
jgi:hypothetical protein